MLLHDMRISEQVIRIFFILFPKRSKANAERTQSEGKMNQKRGFLSKPIFSSY